MYERFTDRARKACQYASDYSQRFDQDCIGDEHILLGLIKEPNGIAHAVLDSLGLTFSGLKNAIENAVGVEMNTIHANVYYEKPQFNDCAKEAIELAKQFAKNLRHDYISTEHLLVGVVSYNGIAREILNDLDIDEIEVVREVEKMLGIEHREPVAEQPKDVKMFEALCARDFGPIKLAAEDAGWEILETSIIKTGEDREEAVIRLGR